MGRHMMNRTCEVCNGKFAKPSTLRRHQTLKGHQSSKEIPSNESFVRSKTKSQHGEGLLPKTFS